MAHRLNFVLCHWSHIIGSFGVECSKYHATTILKVRAEDTRRRCSECFPPPCLLRCLLFPLISVPISIHLECTLKSGVSRRCCFHPAPSKMNIWLKDKTQGVGNQSVNCTISGQPAPSCSHQASWLAEFKAKRRRWKEEVCPVVIHMQSGLELKKGFCFSLKWPPKFNINRYDWDEWFAFTCLRVSLLLICLCSTSSTWPDG